MSVRPLTDSPDGLMLGAMAVDRPQDNPACVAQAQRLAAALDRFDAALSTGGAPEAVVARLAAPAAALAQAAREDGDG